MCQAQRVLSALWRINWILIGTYEIDAIILYFTDKETEGKEEMVDDPKILLAKIAGGTVIYSRGSLAN